MKDNSDTQSIDQDLELGHIFSYAVKENFISETRANQLREQLIKNQSIINNIQNHIGKISKWLEESREGTNQELDRIPKTMPKDVWLDIQEERYEYLENFMMNLKFFVEHPDKEMAV